MKSVKRTMAFSETGTTNLATVPVQIIHVFSRSGIFNPASAQVFKYTK